MNIPHEFEQLVQSFYPGSADEYPTFEDWVSGIVQMMRPWQKVIVARFLDELLNGRHDDAEIQRVWNSMAPSYRFHERHGARDFLILVRDVIAQGDQL